MVTDVLFIIGLPLTVLAVCGLVLTRQIRRANKVLRYEAWRRRWH